jgi:hypothetical protein
MCPPAAFCQLPSAYCPLPTAYCLLPAANCRLPLTMKKPPNLRARVRFVVIVWEKPRTSKTEVRATPQRPVRGARTF